MNSLHYRPLRSVKSSPLPSVCPFPQHPDTHFLAGHAPSPLRRLGRATARQPVLKASLGQLVPLPSVASHLPGHCLLTWKLDRWASWERAGGSRVPGGGNLCSLEVTERLGILRWLSWACGRLERQWGLVRVPASVGSIIWGLVSESLGPWPSGAGARGRAGVRGGRISFLSR